MTSRRRFVEIIEIDIPWCELIYGETNEHGTCSAVLGTTGQIKCFNTKATCQVPLDYSPAMVTLRFARPSAWWRSEAGRRLRLFPSLASVNYSSAKVSLGENLGLRSSMEVRLLDHQHNDTGVGFDKYWLERPWDTMERGTIWGRFAARQPWLRGRSIRRITGFLPDVIEEEVPQGVPMPGDLLDGQVTRHLIIDSTDGPSPTGVFQIVAKDVLKALDDERALAPRLSNGFLAADIADSDVALTLSPAGIGDMEYPEAGYLNIGGSEIVEFERSGDAVTLTGRGVMGTEARDHSAQDRAQVVLVFDGEDPADIIHHLIDQYTEVDADKYVPLEAWQQETAAYFSRLLTGAVADPTPVKRLVSEIIEQAALAIWTDDIAQLIRLRVLRPVSADAVRINDRNVMATNGVTTLTSRGQPQRRISDPIIFFGQNSPLGGQEDTSNYRSSTITPDLSAIADHGSRATKTIYSRWIPVGGRAVADRLGEILQSRFRDPPREVAFDLFDGQPVQPEMGGGAVVEWAASQDATGMVKAVPVQVVSVKPELGRIHYVAEEMDFSFPQADRIIIWDVDVDNRDIRANYDQLYPAPIGGELVRVVINPGVVVGSVSPEEVAAEVGDWPGSDLPLSSAAGPHALAQWNGSATYVLGQYIEHDGQLYASRIDGNVGIEPVPLDDDGESPTADQWVQLVRIIIENHGSVLGAGGHAGRGGNGGNGGSGQTVGSSSAGNGSGGGTQATAGGRGGDAFDTGGYPVFVHMPSGDISSGGGGGGGGGSGGGGGGGGTGNALFADVGGGGGGGAGGGGGGGGGAGSTPGSGGARGNRGSGASGGSAGSDDPGRSGSNGGHGQVGQPGTAEAGGARGNRGGGGSGGRGGINGELNGGRGGAGGTAGHGGAGGNPGEPGQNGGNGSSGSNGQASTGTRGSGGSGRNGQPGGDPGTAIIGFGSVIWIDGNGDPTSPHGLIRGPTIN